MKWTRRALLLALVLLVVMPALCGREGVAWGAAGSHRPTLLPLHRGGPAGGRPVGAPTAIEMQRLGQRWEAVEGLKLLRGVNPASARARRHGATARAFSADRPETLRIAALRVDFQHDSVGAKSTGNGHFELQPDSTQLVDPPPHNRAYFEAHMQALARYYKAQSYGSMVLLYDVYPREDTGAYHLRDIADYGPWTLTQQVVEKATEFVKGTFHQADIGQDSIPWSQYDRVVIFHAGPDFQSDVHQDSPFDIPTFTLGLIDTSQAVVHDRTNGGQEVKWDAASVIPETASQDGLISAINGALAHEFGLLLGSRGRQGVPDLYNVLSGLPVLGTWSIMDSGNLLGTRLGQDTTEIFALGLVPGPHDIWSKLVLFPDVMNGTFDFTADTTFTLRAAEKYPDFGFVSLTEDEYLLLENRETDPDSSLGELRLQTDPKTGVALGTARVRVVGHDTTVTQTNEYDVLQPGSGIICLHVDNSVVDFTAVNATPDGNVNTNPRRPGVGIIQADGSKSIGDPGSPFFQGGPFDPFYVGQISDSLGEDGRPNSRGNSGGLTYVSFRTLTAPAVAMPVEVRRSRALFGWPALDPSGFPAGAAAAADLDGDTFDEYYAVNGGSIYGHTRNGDPVRGLDAHGFPLPYLTVPRAYINPELLTIRGWAGAADAMLMELQDSSKAGFPVKLYALTGNGGILRGFPPAIPSITTPPLRAGGRVEVGTVDGSVWSIDSTGNAVALKPAGPGGAVVGRLARAPFAPQGAPMTAALQADGHVGFVDDGGILHAHGPDAVLPTRQPTLLAAYADPSDSAHGLGATLFVMDSSGSVDAVRPDGSKPAGFPFQLPSHPAGIPTLGSLRSDGRPAILVQTRDSTLTALGMDGRPLPGFPARLPAGNAPTPGAAPLEYRDPQGRPVILVPSTSGDLAGLDSTGKPVDQYPWAVAATWGTGAFWVPGDQFGENTWLLTVGGYGGWRLDSIPGLRHENLVSFGPGVDEAHSGFLSPAHVARPMAAASYTDLGNMRVYPNPLRASLQNELRVRFDLSRSSAVRIRLYDLVGRVVAESHWAGHPASNTVGLPAARLGSGLYHCEVQVGDGGARRVTPVAVVQ